VHRSPDAEECCGFSRTDVSELWELADKEILIRQLRKSLKSLNAREEKLFDALIAEFRKPFGAAKSLSTEKLLKMFGFPDDPTARNEVYNIDYDLKQKIKRASRKLKPHPPRASISHEPYRLTVSNHPPRLLKRYKEWTIALLVADFTDWFVGDFIEGIKEVCGAKYNLIVETSKYDPKREADKMKLFAERVHGLLVVPVSDRFQDAAKKAAKEVPCVLVDRYVHDLIDVPFVHHDDTAVGRGAGAYLKGLGCNRILIVKQGSRDKTRDFKITPLEERAGGCEEIKGVDVTPLPAAGTDEEGGFAALKNFEMKGNIISENDGIFALTDRLAIGCRHYFATERQDLKKVPELISAEGQTFCNFVRPQLTSIKLDSVELGRRAAAVLISKIEAKSLSDASHTSHHKIPPIFPVQMQTARQRDVRDVKL
jgi:DNA-binding LacI/PurR family transcriptional regulator